MAKENVTKLRYANEKDSVNFERSENYLDKSKNGSSKSKNIDQNINIIEDEKERNELSLWQKICFGAAGLPYQLYFCAISVFTTVYLLNTANLPPSKTT